VIAVGNTLLFMNKMTEVRFTLTPRQKNRPA